jgi:hypothetical protein
VHTLISGALRKDETLLGAISIYRQQVRAFRLTMSTTV